MKKSYTKKTKSLVLVWDLPTRVFHWTLVICVLGAFSSIMLFDNYSSWHPKFGIMVLVLVSFRIIWGFFGPFYARFSQFVKLPWNIWKYFLKNKKNKNSAGHNPLGGLSVLFMIGVLGFQAVSGLFITDNILIQGAFYPYVQESISSVFMLIHRKNKWIIIGIIAMHLMAIFFYSYIQNRKIITPMISGFFPSDELPYHTKQARDDFTIRILALIIFVMLVLFFFPLFEL